MPMPSAHASPAKQLARPDTADTPAARQHHAWRQLTPTEKLSLFGRHMMLMRELKTAGVRASHPDWDESRIHAEVARIYLHARS